LPIGLFAYQVHFSLATLQMVWIGMGVIGPSDGKGLSTAIGL
jgi:hypothetical protein